MYNINNKIMKKKAFDSSLEPLEFQANSQLHFKREKRIIPFYARTKRGIPAGSIETSQFWNGRHIWPLFYIYFTTMNVIRQLESVLQCVLVPPLSPTITLYAQLVAKASQFQYRHLNYICILQFSSTPHQSEFKLPFPSAPMVPNEGRTKRQSDFSGGQFQICY